MGKKLSAFFKHPIIVSLTTFGIASLVTTLIPDGWKFVCKTLSAIWTFLTGTIEIPVLLFGILISIVIIFILLIVILFKSERATNNNALTTHIGEHGLKWRYAIGSYGVNLYGPYCPYCDLKLVQNSLSVRGRKPIPTYFCEECNKNLDYYSDDIREKEKRMILRNIRNSTSNE